MSAPPREITLSTLKPWLLVVVTVAIPVVELYLSEETPTDLPTREALAFTVIRLPIPDWEIGVTADIGVTSNFF